MTSERGLKMLRIFGQKKKLFRLKCKTAAAFFDILFLFFHIDAGNFNVNL